MNDYNRIRNLLCLIVALIAHLVTAQTLVGQILTYEFSGLITDVTTNENNVVPNLTTGDAFSGYVSFDSNGWNQTVGTVFATLNGVDLLFDGEYIYGSASVDPGVNYSIRVAADTGGDIGLSSFSAVNFGPDLEDSDGSAGHSELFPASLNLAEFDTNIFRIAGTYVSTGDAVSANGQLTDFVKVPEPATSWLSALVLVVWLRSRIMVS